MTASPTEWIDFFVYAALIVAVWFIGPSATLRMNRALLADRNPEWLAEHPDAPARYTGSRAFLMSCFVIGGLWIACLLAFHLAFQFIEPGRSEHIPTSAVLFQVSMGAVVTCVLYSLVGSGTFYYRIVHPVPLVAKRQATLERRSIDDFIPRWLQAALYALIALHITAWLIVAFFGWHSTPMFWARLVIVFVLSAAFLFMTHVAVRRRPNTLDVCLGPNRRRAEVHMAFGLGFLPPLIGVVRLYEEVTNTIAVDVNRLLFMGIALLCIYSIVRTYGLPRSGSRPGGSTAGIATSP